MPASHLTFDRFRARLAAYTASEPRFGGARRAAVAAVLRFDRGRPEVLLMKRASAPGDRWSGHVALPGGREDDADADLLSTAIRETREEIGIDLGRSGRLLGRLDSIRAVARGKVLPMTITPFVFHREGEVEVVLNHEAESIFWLPLDRAAAGEFDDRHAYALGPVATSLPCWRYGDYVIWGLTFQMLQRLLEVVGVRKRAATNER